MQVKNFAELREIKPIPYKIPYSAEFQNGTSENTLFLLYKDSFDDFLLRQQDAYAF